MENYVQNEIFFTLLVFSFANFCKKLKVENKLLCYSNLNFDFIAHLRKCMYDLAFKQVQVQSISEAFVRF